MGKTAQFSKPLILPYPLFFINYFLLPFLFPQHTLFTHSVENTPQKSMILANITRDLLALYFMIWYS